MEPFSLALGVLTVVETSAQAAKTLYDFAKTVRDANDEIQGLTADANNLYSVLRRIEEALLEPKVAAYVEKNPGVQRELATLKDPLKRCEKKIEEFIVKLEKSTDRSTGRTRTIKSIRWYFVKDDVNATRVALAQTRDTATFAFSGLNLVETLRKSAEHDEPDAEKSKPSPGEQLFELQKQGSDLRRAAYSGDVRQIELLLEAGTPVDSRDDEGRTALSYAAEYGHIETVKLLLGREAFANAASNVIQEGNYFKKAESKRTPLHWAAAGGHILVAGLLLDKYAKIEASTMYQRTPALEAAMNDHFKTVKSLLERGADVNARTYNGWTMLHTASANGKLEWAELLLSRGADIEAAYEGKWRGDGDEEKEATYQHPLHYAVRPKRRPSPDQTAMIRMLITKGHAKPSAQDSKGSTPIHYAVRSGWKEALEVLLRYATVNDIATRDAAGATPVDVATGLRQSEMVEMFKVGGDRRSKSLSMRAEETFP